MIEISDRIITSVGLGKQVRGKNRLEFTNCDGVGLFQKEEYYIHNCIIDLSSQSLEDIDECVAVTWGASAVFKSCIIRGAGKLILCGSGDEDHLNDETGKTVKFDSCIFEDFGRRGPEVQSGVKVTLSNCLIRNWGYPERFSVRNFGAWAHHSGEIEANYCIFYQDSFFKSLTQFFIDVVNHIGQAVNDNGFLAVFNPINYIPGVCRGLTSSSHGNVSATNCWKNHWWIRLQNSKQNMEREEAIYRLMLLEEMKERLECKLTSRS